MKPHWLEQARRLREAGYSFAQIAVDVDAPRSSIARWLETGAGECPGCGGQATPPGQPRFVGARARTCQNPECPGGGSGKLEQHHVVYVQHVRAEGGNAGDPRDGLTLCTICHTRHHRRVAPVRLSALRDETFEFARELLGGPKAYEYLRRRYAGADPRLEALLNEEEDTMEERTFPCGKSEPYPQIIGRSREERVALVAGFLQEYEDDMHLEARGEPFAFASREDAARKLLARLGLAA
jgi:hypothetical protein